MLRGRRRERESSTQSTALRDTLVAVAIVGALVAAVFLYSGRWPPLVVIESGSMMHDQGVPYGRVGTIDPGDIVFVKKITKREDVSTWAEGQVSRYGKAGDVIIYHPFNDSNAVPVIHRAMAWVEVVHQARATSYRVEWTDHRVLVFNSSGIYLPALGFDESHGFTPAAAFRPFYSGFITKGDNPLTNSAADQAGLTRADRISDLVQLSWIEGKARAEVPWFGLAKLVFSPGINQANPNWIRVGNAFAPYDLWTCLGFSIALVIVSPLAYDVVQAWRERRAIRRDLANERRATEAAQSPSKHAAPKKDA